MIDKAEIELRSRIGRLQNETIDLRDRLNRRREIVKSTADKLFDAERRLAAARQQLADYQMAQKTAAERRATGVAEHTEQLRGPAVSVEIVRM